MVVKVKSKNQKGGITAGIINFGSSKRSKGKGVWDNNWFKYVLIPIVVIIIASIFYNMVFDKTDSGESYDVTSYNQSGGVTAGKIENVNILTDKESLGIREPGVLYRDGKRVGRVIGFNVDESANTFTILKIEFDGPMRYIDEAFMPYELGDYLISVNNADTVIMAPLGSVSDVSGVILAKNE